MSARIRGHKSAFAADLLDPPQPTCALRALAQETMRRGFANRVDATEKPLVAYAKSIGFGYAKNGGDWDGDLFWGRTVIPVEWKTPEVGTTKPKQLKLIAAGFPLRFISTPAQLDALRSELMQGRS